MHFSKKDINEDTTSSCPIRQPQIGPKKKKDTALKTNGWNLKIPPCPLKGETSTNPPILWVPWKFWGVYNVDIQATKHELFDASYRANGHRRIQDFDLPTHQSAVLSATLRVGGIQCKEVDWYIYTYI